MGLWLLKTTPAGAAEAGPNPREIATRRWTEAEGLPDDTVTALAQTADGYLWVGTGRGLARFDGVKFETIGLPPRPGLAPVAVTALLADSVGRLWVGTESLGLLCYHRQVVRCYSERDRSLSTNVTSLAEDTAGNLWVGTRAGLARIGGAGVARYSTEAGLPSEWVTSIHAGRSGSVWVTTRGGMCQYEQGKWRPLQFQAESPGRSPEYIGVYEDRQGNLWAFGDTYLVNLSEGKRFNYFRSGDTSSRRIWSLREGRQGQLWIGTSGQGLFSFREGKFMPLALREGVLSSDVRALWEDADENLWLGTRGGGLTRLQWRHRPSVDATLTAAYGRARCLAAAPDGRAWAGFERGGLFALVGERWEEVGWEQGFEAQNLVATLCPGPDGSLWVGTLGMGLYRLKDRRAVHFTSASGLADDSVLAVAVSRDGTVWAGTRAGTLHRLTSAGWTGYGKREGLSGGAITALLPTHDGRLWIGTDSGGLWCGQEGRFTAVRGAAGLVGHAIRALTEDALWRVWVGAAGLGLSCYAADGALVCHLPALTSDEEPIGLLSDTAGNLWYAADQGIYRISARELRRFEATAPVVRQVFETPPGLGKGWARGWPGAVRLPDGRLWFALPGGQVSLDPSSWEAPARPLPVYIEKVRVNGGAPLQPPGTPGGEAGAVRPPTRLPANLRSLEIQFTAVELSAPERVRFQHRLDGFDADWVDADRERRARYGRLPRGEYRFRVRATQGDGLWREADESFAFVLPTPAWQSGGAFTLYGLCLTGLVAGAVRLVSHRRLRRKVARLAQQQATEKERVRIARDMHDEIGSKLTRISFLSELALRAQEPARENLQAIAGTSRDLLQTLDELVWAVNPRNDTLEQVAAYFGQYATEYLQNTALEFELTIAKDLPPHPLSAEARHNLFLAFEEALGNALKHACARRIWVDIAVHSSQLEIVVRDDGRGFAPRAADAEADAPDAARPGRHGHGLANMRQRLANAGGQCAIASRPGDGTQVTFRLALNPTGPNRP